MATWIVGGLLVLLVALAVRYVIQMFKNGGCAGCPSKKGGCCHCQGGSRQEGSQG